MKNMKHVKFLGYEGGTYASFEINRELLPNGNCFEKLLVAHEGRWLDEDGMFCHPEYKFYEDVQKGLGIGLTFVKKEYSEFLNRTLFLYDFEYSPYYKLAVPATGEEIYFEIYGVDNFGACILLEEMEL